MSRGQLGAQPDRRNILIDFCFQERAGLPADYDVIGPWSEVKLDILREYTSPYSRIVTAHGFHHLYIDAYAAGGSHISRTTEEIVPGSPLIALATEPPFREYHFIDANPAESINSGVPPRIVPMFTSTPETAMKYCCAMCSRVLGMKIGGDPFAYSTRIT